MIRRILVLLVWLGLVPVLSAQEVVFRHQLLSLLPDDFAVCVAMHDLRGQSASWQSSDWFTTFRKSPLGKTLFEAPELKQFDRWQTDLKKHFDLDWPALRDDILGDNVLFVFSPGAANKRDDDHGLLLLHVARPQQLALFIDKLNDLQKKSGELKELTPVKHKEITYFRRERTGKTHFYLLHDSLAAISSEESRIRSVIDKHALAVKETVWTKRFQKAAAEQAFVTMCINPREIKPDFVQAGKKDDGLPGYWQALDGIFVTFAIKDDAAVRISIQVDTERLPKWTRSVFTQRATPSDLWQRFPEASIVTIAGRTDIAGTMDALKLLLPEKERKNVGGDLQRGIGAILGLDLFKDVLPNIGPDWGGCMLPAKDAQHLPQTLIAVAVKPGTKDPPVDQSLFNALQLFASLSILNHNKKNPDPILLQTMMQDKVEVKYLSNAKLFPPGLQPACALKDGFLLLGSSPDAIRTFRKRDTKPDATEETPLLRVSTRELAKLLRQREDEIVTNLQQRHAMPDREAKQNLQSVTSLLDMFERVTISQNAEAGQANWTLRLTPARK